MDRFCVFVRGCDSEGLRMRELEKFVVEDPHFTTQSLKDKYPNHTFDDVYISAVGAHIYLKEKLPPPVPACG